MDAADPITNGEVTITCAGVGALFSRNLDGDTAKDAKGAAQWSYGRKPGKAKAGWHG